MSLGFSQLSEVIILKNRLHSTSESGSLSNSRKNQLSTNQVILLLQKLGFMQIIENSSTTEQAKLISRITGYHDKNLKKSIERLDKKKSDLPKQQEEDQAIVNKTIMDLKLILNLTK